MSKRYRCGYCGEPGHNVQRCENARQGRDSLPAFIVCVREVAERHGLAVRTVRRRLARGWPIAWVCGVRDGRRRGEANRGGV